MAEAVSVKYIPFFYVFHWLWDVVTFKSFKKLDDVAVMEAQAHTMARGYSHRHCRPRVAGGGANLPLLVIAALSEWLAVIDARGTGGKYLLSTSSLLS